MNQRSWNLLQVASLFLIVLGLGALAVRLEIILSPQQERVFLTASRDIASITVSGFSLTDPEKAAVAKVGGMPLTFTVDHPSGKTSENFSVSLRDVRLNPPPTLGPPDIKTLDNLLTRLEAARCIDAELHMPGMQFDPEGGVTVDSQGTEWSLWTDKKGDYAGRIELSASCLQDPIQIQVDAHDARFTDHVSSPWIEPQAVVKSGLDFCSAGFTLSGLIGWIKARKQKKVAAANTKKTEIEG